MQTVESIEDKVIEITAMQFTRDASEITRDTAFVADLNADSLDMVELALELEDAFETSIPDVDVDRIATVGQAVDLITEQCRKK